ncbi:unnamed protein product [Clonostachys rosea]|uniref:Ubiquitin carboxyl-terminal hydrolase n=1 Tax=Bionectria ochroleuca TaxID=29856 RepID=A0ABY6V238_BIOOC|nr:unnamed protein product [Clonostachys rosea]
MAAKDFLNRPVGTKTFIPLENNPDVFTSLVHELGLSPKLRFFDVYSLDDPDLLAMVPRPAQALIFITPAPMYYAVRKEDGLKEVKTADELTYNKSGDQEPVVWYLQTINHACGLIALLHAASNGDVRQSVNKDSILGRLIESAVPLEPGPRADLLYNSEELEKAHMNAARTGDSAAPQAEDPCGYHFLAFVRGKDGHLWELEGGSDGPIDRGSLPDGSDMLSAEALELGVKRFLKFSEGNLEFSIIALSESE